jgi:site-specific DNA recombinase
MKQLRVAIYGRVSGQKQADEANIETQKDVNEAWCANKKAIITGYYFDNPCRNKVPIHKRKEGQRLLRDAKDGAFDVVLVYMIDRWSRTRRVFYDGLDALTESNVGFASATQTFETYTPGGRAFLNMLTVFAELDRDMIEVKLTDGKTKWTKTTYEVDGQEYSFWMGGRTPYGYRVVEIQRRSGLVVDDELITERDFSSAQVVRWCYEWAVYERISCAAIARRLNARQAPRCAYLDDGGKGRLRRPTGYNYWTPQNVGQLLHRTIYKGEHTAGLQSRTGRALVPLRYPAIVSAEVWGQAQVALKERRTFSDRNAKHQYLLRGLIKCGCCGYGFVATARYGGGKERPGRWHYLCQSKHDQRRTRKERDGLTCTAKPIRETIETLVWDDICEFLRHPGKALEELRQQMEATLGRSDQIQEEALRERANLDAQRLREKRLVKLYTEGRVSDSLYDEEKQEIMESMATIAERIEALDHLLENEERVSGRLHTAQEFLNRMQERAQAAREWTWEAKRTLVELWVRQVWVDPPQAPGAQPTVRIQYLFSDPVGHTTDEDTCPNICNSFIYLERAYALPRAA